MVTILIAVLALLVALVALLRDTREHRRNRTADVQALMFQSNRSGVVTHINGDRGLRKFEPSVHASGFGTRYDVRTYLWVDDQVEPKWKDLSQSADRFDNTSEPLRCEIESTTTIPAECGLASDTTSPRYGGAVRAGPRSQRVCTVQSRRAERAGLAVVPVEFRSEMVAETNSI